MVSLLAAAELDGASARATVSAAGGGGGGIVGVGPRRCGSGSWRARRRWRAGSLSLVAPRRYLTGPVAAGERPTGRSRAGAGSAPADDGSRSAAPAPRPDAASAAVPRGCAPRSDGPGTTPVVPAVFSTGPDEVGSRDGIAGALVAGFEVTAEYTPGPSAGSRLTPIAKRIKVTAANRSKVTATLPSQRSEDGRTGVAAADIVESVALTSV